MLLYIATISLLLFITLQVVMSFLEAIGGEEEEIDSVNDLEHEEKSLQNS